MEKPKKHDKPYIHRVGDGRGNRRIFIDGQEMKNVIYANVKTGDVTFFPKPMRVEFGEVFCCTLRGRVKVVSVSTNPLWYF